MPVLLSSNGPKPIPARVLVLVFFLSGACSQNAPSRSDRDSDRDDIDAGSGDAGSDSGFEVIPPGSGRSLQFFGGDAPAGQQQIDRVRIRIDGPEVPADVGSTDFTIELWLKTTQGAGSCIPGQLDNWIGGTIFLDQDIIGSGDHGDYGMSVMGNGTIAFGVAVGGSGGGLCGATSVANGQWHHVAITRSVTTGQLRLFVDGALDGQTMGTPGNASYRNNRSGSEADPYLTLGGEKHAFEGYPWYAGRLDELRLSRVIRYVSAFSRPSAPFATDSQTVALYHFDEGSGTVVSDTSGATGGPSNGELLVGGNPAGPIWSTDAPF